MRLKKLILHGFKSFADRTELTFDAPITAIVGPNGCGKSNVVDSVRWVLGEQSAKSLRGEAMTDVIFNGSTTRKAAAVAEVTLVFDNPKDASGQRFLNYDADEVAVTRRLFRDGTCQYELNNTQCRLKDIRELFYDTGVGVDAYSVIEQGRVDVLLQADPQERRAIFEEAAGISKFKARRKEAVRKLERVDQNLLRLTDIADEVEKRLRSVRIQAGRARTWQEHSNRLRELRLTYALQEYYTLQTQLDQQVAEESRLQTESDAVAGRLAEIRMELAAARQRLDELSRNRQKLEYELVETRAAADSARQQQQHALRQIEQADEQSRQLDADRTELQTRAVRTNEHLAEQRHQLDELTAQLAACQAEIQTRQEDFRRTQHQLNELVRAIEQQKTASLEAMRRGAAINNRLAAIEIERRSAAAQQQRLSDRRQAVSAELESLHAAAAELTAGIETTARDLEALGAQLREAGQQAAALDRHIASVGDQLAAAREHRSGLLSRQRLLADLEARREGVSDAVKAALARRDGGLGFIRGLVADIIRVDVEHAAVIEAALDGRDQMLVADDSLAVAAAAEELADLPGRVSVLCRDRLPDGPETPYDWNRHGHLIRIAADLTRHEPQDAPVVHHLLGRTAVVDSLADALALQRCGPPGWRYVTRDCELVEADGSIRAGPLTESMGIISRRSELDALALQIAEVDRRIGNLAHQLEAANAEARAVQQRQESLRSAQYQTNTRKVELESRLSQNADRRAALARESAVIEREMEALAAQIQRIGDEEADLLARRSEVEAEAAAIAEQGRRLSEQHAGAQDALRQCGEALTALRVRHGQVQEKQLAAHQAAQRLAGLCEELRQQIDRVDRAIEQAQLRRRAAEEDLHRAQERQSQCEQRETHLAARIADLERDSAAAQSTVVALSQREQEIDASRARLEQALHQLQMRIGETRVRRENLVQRTADELQLDLPARWHELEQQGGYQPSETDWNAVAEEIRQLKDKLHRLGNVNLEAITEQEELEKRSGFLSVQLGDLKQSKKQLEELIDQINRDSAQRFEKTLNAVRQHFQSMFRKLFGGGNADICLETELAAAAPAPADGASQDGASAADAPPAGTKKYDILEAGIEIIAKPPGKQPCSISQLSGGERTMTCIALLMSVFKSRPSPFCLLDEVDAAMDEANNQRFNLLVQEFLDQSQFIIITHSKRTMQIADVLYGITMQEHGVSRKVAVRFEQVDAEGRISESAAA